MKRLLSLVLVAALSSSCAATLVSATKDAVKASEAARCTSVNLPGCLTLEQFQEVNAILNALVLDEIVYVQIPSPNVLQTATMTVEVANAMTQIANLLGPNADAIVKALKGAVGKA